VSGLSSNIENEVKLRIASVEQGAHLLISHGFTVRHPRQFEANQVYDTQDTRFRQRGELVRLRRAGDRTILTFKSADLPGHHKRREEIETSVSDPAALDAIFQRLGLTMTFRYEKYRTEYQRSGETGVVTLDETPIGTFLELEGPPEWVDATAHDLGFSAADYILSSYAALWLEYCRTNDGPSGHMVF
jgi:adenylate cyclase class 2